MANKMMQWITLFTMGLVSIHVQDAAGQVVDQLRIDLAILLDASGSVHDTFPNLWTPQLDLIKRLLGDLVIGPNNVQVAVVTFNGEPRVQWQLNGFPTRQGNIDALDNLQFAGGQSDIYNGLETVRTHIFGSELLGDRPNATNRVIIFSDGKATKNVDLTETAAQDLMADGIELFSISIGDNPNEETLKYMASTPNERFTLDQLFHPTNVYYSSLVSRLNIAERLNPFPTNPCASNPCMNGGQCSSSENPYGWTFYCYCGPNAGGRLCQIVAPCDKNKCPLGFFDCLRASTLDIGRFCYNSRYQILP